MAFIILQKPEKFVVESIMPASYVWISDSIEFRWLVINCWKPLWNGLLFVKWADEDFSTLDEVLEQGFISLY